MLASFVARGMIVLLAASLAACGHDAAVRASRTKNPQDAPSPDVRAESAEEGDADARIAEAVRGELAADPAVDAEAITVDVDQGVVELSGVVPHLLMADAALSRAEMVHGVVAVIDRMELERSDRPDEVVRRDVEGALRDETSLRITAPAVRVVEGVVTLRGTAESFEDRQLAERIARAVRGARDVVSQIEIRAGGAQGDAEIREEVERALRADRWVDEWLLDLEVDEGVVALSGVQPTAAAKRRAIESAWVSGVRDVDATLVEVDPDLPPERRRPPRGYAYPRDPEIAASVRAVLARDPRFRPNGVQVEVREGTARLSGRAPTLEAKRVATELAEGVHGVWRVENELRVPIARDLNDAEIEQRIDRALSRAAAIDAEALTAEVRNGVVTLLGSVETPYARTVAEEVIARVHGVRRLDNRIEAPERAEGPPPDDVLLQNVMAHLEAHPYVDAARIDVTVSNGEVMLRGEVSDWRAQREAIRAAHEAGATNVLDDLEVLEAGRE